MTFFKALTKFFYFYNLNSRVFIIVCIYLCAPSVQYNIKSITILCLLFFFYFYYFYKFKYSHTTLLFVQNNHSTIKSNHKIKRTKKKSYELLIINYYWHFIAKQNSPLVKKNAITCTFLLFYLLVFFFLFIVLNYYSRFNSLSYLTIHVNSIRPPRAIEQDNK